jgi:hypothetical protein
MALALAFVVMAAPAMGYALQSDAPAAASGAPKPHPVAAKAADSRAAPAAAAAPKPLSAAENAAAVSEDAEYHEQLEAAAASLKADIQAESDASAAAITDNHPSMTGVIAAVVIAGLGLIALIIIIPVSLRARKRRREMAIDLISGKPKDRKR